jgi:outer membrane protein assembly factor BamB
MARLLIVALLTAVAVQGAEPKQEALWAAAKKGDVEQIESLLAAGVDVNARTDYGVTALILAAQRGHTVAVKALLAHQANPNLEDTFYKIGPLSLAASARHAAVVVALLDAGAEKAEGILGMVVPWGDASLVERVLQKGKFQPEILSRALNAAKDRPEIIAVLEKAGAVRLPPVGDTVTAEMIAAITGTFRTQDGMEASLVGMDGKLMYAIEGRPILELRATGEDTFAAADNSAMTFKLQREDGKVSGFAFTRAGATLTFNRAEPTRIVSVPPAVEERAGPIVARNWPSFRGPGASGVGDDQWPPTTWELAKGTNVRWKTPIPGLAHSCPIIWGDRVYVTTAVRAEGKADLKIGLYGDVQSVEDASEHSWHVYCLDKKSGQILWEQVAHQGVPRIKRHTKGTHANCTPATDGMHVIANFASEGLFCYDRDGPLLWRRELGTLNSGWFFDADYQWGFGSSPIIYRDLVIVQCDVGRESFIAAFRLIDGSEAWRTQRDEIPSWGTPTIVEALQRVELVTNGTKFARGYDALNGTELWRLARQSEITVPTPIFADGLIFVASGYRPIRPIYAIRPGAIGDISLESNETANEHIAWSTQTGGPYMPTPIAYRGCLYTVSNDGIFACYEAPIGKLMYRQRLPGKGVYTASPVAADGKLYLTSEDGGVRVVKAGPTFVLLAENSLGEPCLATPAISDGMIIFRTESQVMAMSASQPPPMPTVP